MNEISWSRRTASWLLLSIAHCYLPFSRLSCSHVPTHRLKSITRQFGADGVAARQTSSQPHSNLDIVVPFASNGISPSVSLKAAVSRCESCDQGHSRQWRLRDCTDRKRDLQGFRAGNFGYGSHSKSVSRGVPRASASDDSRCCHTSVGVQRTSAILICASSI